MKEQMDEMADNDYWNDKLDKPCEYLYCDFGAPMCRIRGLCFFCKKIPNDKDCPKGRSLKSNQ